MGGQAGGHTGCLFDLGRSYLKARRLLSQEPQYRALAFYRSGTGPSQS
ncbi:hypothetical protein WME79_07360 [Sorangium sp. So ce726]